MKHYKFKLVLMLLVTVMATSISTSASAAARVVELIYGTGFQPNTLKDGDKLPDGKQVSTDNETILVLSNRWPFNGGFCEEYVIIRGERYKTEPGNTNDCEETGEGDELAEAMSGKSMVGKIRVFQLADAKADLPTPQKLASLYGDLRTLKEKSASEPQPSLGQAENSGSLHATRHDAVRVQKLEGVYTIQQKSNGRYMDAHEGTNDNAVVTRDRQNNNTQRWVVTPVGNNVYTIQQRSNGRYLDAHEGVNDNAVVTRNKQNNDTQRWIITPSGKNTYTVRQKSNGRYMDAHEGTNDNAVVTRDRQNNDTQRWIFRRL